MYNNFGYPQQQPMSANYGWQQPTQPPMFQNYGQPVMGSMPRRRQVYLKDPKDIEEVRNITNNLKVYPTDKDIKRCTCNHRDMQTNQDLYYYTTGDNEPVGTCVCPQCHDKWVMGVTADQVKAACDTLTNAINTAKVYNDKIPEEMCIKVLPYLQATLENFPGIYGSVLNDLAVDNNASEYALNGNRPIINPGAIYSSIVNGGGYSPYVPNPAGYQPYAQGPMPNPMMTEQQPVYANNYNYNSYYYTPQQPMVNTNMPQQQPQPVGMDQNRQQYPQQQPVSTPPVVQSNPMNPQVQNQDMSQISKPPVPTPDDIAKALLTPRTFTK